VIVKSNIDAEWDDQIELAIKKTYGRKIRKPIYIHKEHKLIHYYGLHGTGNLKHYKRLPFGMDSTFARTARQFHNGDFHYITISHEGLMENKTEFDGRAYWDYSRMYTADQLRNPYLVFLTTLITHELAHAWHNDTDRERTKYKRIKQNDLIDQAWHEDIKEYDAEKIANGLRPYFYERLTNGE